MRRDLTVPRDLTIDGPDLLANPVIRKARRSWCRIGGGEDRPQLGDVFDAVRFQCVTSGPEVEVVELAGEAELEQLPWCQRLDVARERDTPVAKRLVR